MAISATDHSEIHPFFVDLREADFEIGTTAAADNPAVPNLTEVGLEPFVREPYNSPLIATGHVLFLAEPLDPRALPIGFRDPQGRGYVRIPREKIVEAVAFGWIHPRIALEHPPCIPMIHEAFDRYEDASRGLGLPFTPFSLVRRVLAMEGGRAVLQNTNTTAADFVHGDYSPGSVP